ncbi:unnamed protein product [Durusdinium trenchii]|uniref:BTB domain-containing protein n=1 Tax=Durusdinium trenchii TaxID=1381693 RepID=A0ABP0N535_9DINO
MTIRARAGARVKECSGEFEVANFPVTCATTKTVSEGKQDCREIVSGPILVAKQYTFGIAVAWSVKPDGTVEESKNLGVHVKRLDDNPEECNISLEITILNRLKNFHMTLCDPTYHGISSQKARGWSRSFDMPDSRRHDGVKGLPLSDVFDHQAGWLHNGPLRVVAKLSVVVSFDSGVVSSNEASGQQEVCQSLQALLQSGSMADVALKVGSEEIQAHSIILGARSPVFERMFSCPMKEKKDKEVHIQDLEAAPVKALVKYLYTGVVDQTSLDNDNLALSLLEAAHRYEVPGLVERCVQVIVTRFKVETVAERLEMADMIGSKYFKAQCLEYIQAHLVDVQATDAYTRLVERRPALLRDIIEVVAPPSKKQRRLKAPFALASRQRQPCEPLRCSG